VIWGLVVALYAATWVGGVPTHTRDIDVSAQGRYQMLRARNAERCGPQTGDPVPIYARLLEGGLHTGIDWSAPLLPGLLLVDSYEVLGPLHAQGSTKLLVFDGHGFIVVCEWREWVA
jgi:hypothetical protein